MAAGLIRVLMIFAPAWGLIDHPGHRKVHLHPTPLVGGLGMLLTLILLQILTGRLPFESLSLLVALAIITGIGVADDAHELSHRAKFVAQALGAGVIVSGTSVWVTGLGDLLGIGNIELGKWAILVTIISVVGVMNAINMIDGLDGLAASVSLMPVLVLAALAYHAGQAGPAFELALLAAVIFGFLLMNLRLPGRPRALVFMGDTGGMIIGMLIAWYSIKLGGSSNAAVAPITAVWILAMPLLDMGSVMLVRLMQRKSPFHADQQHMHHVLLHAGYSVNQVVGIMSALSLCLGATGIFADRHGVPQALMFLAFLLLWAAYVVALKHPAVIQSIARRVLSPYTQSAGSTR
ncbi:MAG: undecaprenyl/decaprenyl-phosphate alpha-N-acetylglucosaminyl 1-phosphate transferase [Rhodocyclales bacterium]|nr:undecaprenyl/decaprenyl-phosphate alpha-N-acetylglucosaminyl 1-phosphate transferase [Rhodocyclales bacterium]